MTAPAHDQSAAPSPGADEFRERELPLLQRAAIVYLVSPLAVWLLGWFRPWVGLPAVALLAAGLWRALSGRWRIRAPSRTAAALLFAALALTMLTEAGGVLRYSPDWRGFSAMFLDLSWGEWPTWLTNYLGAPELLRFYLGYFMAPSLAARLFGAGALDWAVPLWTWCGTALALLLWTRGLGSLRAAALAVAALFLFGGLDVLDHLLTQRLAAAAHTPPDGYGVYFALIWFFRGSPYHFFANVLAVALLLQLKDNPRFLAMGGIVVVACFFWAALSATGLVPLAVAAVIGRKRVLAALSWQNLCVALPLGALVALYLASGKMDFESGWISSEWDSRWRFGARLAVLYATEFAALAFVLWRIGSRGYGRFLGVAVVALPFAQVWHYGYDGFNEWGVKFAVPLLLVLAYCASRAVTSQLPEVRSAPRIARPVAFWALVAMLVVGTAPVVRHLGDATIAPISYTWSGESAMTDLNTVQVEQRATSRVPPLLRALLRSVEAGGGREGDLVASPDGVEVYLEGGSRLVHVRRVCNAETNVRTWLFLEIEAEATRPRRTGADWPPYDVEARPAGHTRWIVRSRGPDGDLLYWRLGHPLREKRAGGCIWVAKLPRYPVATVRTGQLDFAGRPMWEAVLPLGRIRHSRP